MVTQKALVKPNGSQNGTKSQEHGKRLKGEGDGKDGGEMCGERSQNPLYVFVSNNKITFRRDT